MSANRAGSPSPRRPSSRFRLTAFWNWSYLHFWVLLLIHTLLLDSASGSISVISQITEGIIISFDDSPSISMPDEKVEYGIEGYVVYSTPPDACTRVNPPPEYPEEANYILLAKHTPSTPNCSFTNKTKYAFEAGYAGLIIHNVGSNSTDDFDEAVDPAQTIVYATFIGEYHGLLLRDNFSYPKDKYFKTFVRVRHDGPTTNQWLVYLVAFLVILCFCALLVVPILMLWNSAVTCLEKIRRIRRRKLRLAIINKFPINDWSEGDPQQSCVICLDDFEPHDKVRILPCSHGFHAECIDPWLQKCKKFCPICKRKVIVLNENVEATAAPSDSDDETTPLLRREPSTSAMSPSINSSTRTSGRTFARQRENPFRRAFRRARHGRSRTNSGTDDTGPISDAIAVTVPADQVSGPSTSAPSTSGAHGGSSSSSAASSSSDSDRTFHIRGGPGAAGEPSVMVLPEVTVIVNHGADDDSRSHNIDVGANANENTHAMHT